MTVLLPTSIAEAVGALAAGEAQLLAGGTDFMVEVNAGRRQPHAIISLDRIDELKRWERVGNMVRLGAGVTYAEMLGPGLARLLPALAQSARTVGSPQIRNAGTIGGDLGTAPPARAQLPR